MRKIYVTTRIEINDEADPGEVVQEMDYRFKHPDIVSHEIVDTEWRRLIPSFGRRRSRCP